MPYVYRRPFDYPQHRQAFNVWAMQGLLEGTAPALSLTAHQATVTSTAGAGSQYSRATRYGTDGVFRRRWPHAQMRAKVFLIYTDADAIDASRPVVGFTGHAATVQLGANPGAAVAADDASGAFTTHDATVQGGRRDPYELGRGTLTGHAATLTRTAGLGPSRTGAVSAKPSGTYQSGSTRAPRRRVVSTTNLITRAK